LQAPKRYEIERVMDSMDFKPQSNMFERRDQEETDSLERASSEEDFE